MDVVSNALFNYKKIRADGETGFVSLALDKCAYENSVTLDFSKPGGPTDNLCIQSFNDRRRVECLNTNWFMSLENAQER